MKRLTKKEKGFVKDYIKTDNATLAAKRNYEIESPDIENVAASIGSENLTKPKIIKAIADAFPDQLLAEKHLELLNKREKVIIERKNDDGSDVYEVLDQPETQAVGKALDMAYKIKGSYQAEKPVSPNLNIFIKIENKELEAVRQKYEKELKTKLLT